MSDQPRDDGQPEDEFRDMLRAFLSGNSDIDPSRLASAAGLPSDPAAVSNLMQQLQNAMQASGDGIDWTAAERQAVELAGQGGTSVTDQARAQYDQVLHVASLWLDEATSLGDSAHAPGLMTRAEWAKATTPVWSQLAEPVASSISDALTSVLQEQAPEEMSGMLAGASQLMRNLGGTLFAMQLGQIIGRLSREVVSGGDVGIPLLDEGRAVLVPQNIAEFGEGLDIPDDQVQLYLAVRELAHARLFRHARWLRLHLISSIRDFARGISIDTSRLEELAAGFDPQNPEELRDAMASGALIPPRTEQQEHALARIETTLALIEGWVDVVTANASSRLPTWNAVAETVRRRRATGGPAESAFGALIGLELRPRRLREAAAMWQQVTDAVGVEQRDALWSHPDVMPTGEDVDDPAALIARLTAGAPEPDEMDQALEELLRAEEKSGDADGDDAKGDDEPGQGDQPPVV
ncbi:zinc-dependent metalloprotease [Cnuibacter physcomitrellae]|uniref:zinc-dependent metalloprotease n=1 Tax=Cnuibacter physcomitrellae TaxID=1619308 RepID=UPI002175CBD8|nr:zinc-dependent metalloprotease [Cnuibacter physcomitrellae]MCS5496606.1 zinc-dependent metalloprotease [Cnuibacter physcomitrellae]